LAGELHEQWQVSKVSRAHVVLFGRFDGERTELVNRVALEFGWETIAVRHLDELAVAPEPAAVLVHVTALGDAWPSILEAIRRAAPYSCIVACLGFGDHVDWPELREAGAFDLLHLPLAESEVRQTLGFVASSQQHGYLSHLVWLAASVLQHDGAAKTATAAAAMNGSMS
jgi:hypothetical protein